MIRREAASDSLLVHSELLRSLETAEIIAAENREMERLQLSLLSPYGDPSTLASWVTANTNNNIVLVGHEPQLSSLASFLLLGETKPILILKKSGLVILKKDHGSWSLRALLAAKFY